jgi:hypothetical protein
LWADVMKRRAGVMKAITQASSKWRAGGATRAYVKDMALLAWVDGRVGGRCR